MGDQTGGDKEERLEGGPCSVRVKQEVRRSDGVTLESVEKRWNQC